MHRLCHTLYLFLLLSTLPAGAQPSSVVRKMLDGAADRFDIPRSVLYGVSYNESRWIHRDSDSSSRSCTGMPPMYGIMGLHDDDHFGHSLRAGEGIGISAEEAQWNIEMNIIVGAWYLSTLFDGIDRSDPNQWLSAVGRYSGIPESQPALQLLYADGVIELLHHGWHADDVRIEPVDLHRVDRAKLSEDLGEMGLLALDSDYPGATWDPSPNFSGRGGSDITAVTIHDTEGGFAGSLSWLKNTQAQASAHYIIRSVDGFTVQMVREADKAWHVGRENPYTVGIEHEGFVSRPEYFTSRMYAASASLTRHLIERYNIPLDREHVKGHIDFPNNTHTDPGGWWDWPGYYRLIAGESARRVVVDPFEDNVVGWWQPAMSGSTVGIDADRTRFAIDNSSAFSGMHGGLLEYSFTEADGGVVRLFRSGHGNTSDGLLNVGNSGTVSLEVRGDGSGHALEIWFYDNAKNNVIYPLGGVSWRGWRTLLVPVASLGSNGPYRFNSVVIRQRAGHGSDGGIAIDDLAHVTGTLNVEETATETAATPDRIVLHLTQPLPDDLRRMGNVTIINSIGETVASFESLPDEETGSFLSPGVYSLRCERGTILLMLAP